MSSRIIPFKERLRKKKKRILVFISTGNTCRSPMAAAYLRHLIAERGIETDVEVRSAGVMTVSGLMASPDAVQVLGQNGVDLTRHRSTQLTPELIRKADIIMAMSTYHQQRATRISEDARDKTVLLKEFVKSDPKNVQITDPMGCTLEVFKKVFKEIRVAVDLLVEHPYIVGDNPPEPPKPAKPAKKAAKKSTSKKSSSGSSTKKSSSKTAGKKTAAKSSEKKPATKKKSTAQKTESKASTKKAATKKKATAKKTTTKKAAAKKKTPSKKAAKKSSSKKSSSRK